MPKRWHSSLVAKPVAFIEGFEEDDIDTGDLTIHLERGGSGPPLLLLHGYPQTHAMWHKVAPKLAEDYSVIVPDLRGYGDSSKPAGDPAHETYSFRAMARDQVAVMTALGYDDFALVGHDRGGRVSHRLTLDHPDAVSRLCVLDIIPTRTLYQTADQRIATGYYHWYFLIQPFDFPERMIGADPEWYIRGRTENFASAEAVAEYVRCFSDPACIHATCEDYRAGASIDLAHDEDDLGQKIECPFLVLWGEKGLMGRAYDVADTWRERVRSVQGQGMPCGHFIPEEAPDETVAALQDFLAG